LGSITAPLVKFELLYNRHWDASVSIVDFWDQAQIAPGLNSDRSGVGFLDQSQNRLRTKLVTLGSIGISGIKVKITLGSIGISGIKVKITLEVKLIILESMGISGIKLRIKVKIALEVKLIILESMGISGIKLKSRLKIN